MPRTRSYRNYQRAAEACRAFLWEAFHEGRLTSIVLYQPTGPVVTVRTTPTGITADRGRGAWPLGPGWHRADRQLADILTALGQRAGLDRMVE